MLYIPFLIIFFESLKSYHKIVPFPSFNPIFYEKCYVQRELCFY